MDTITHGIAGALLGKSFVPEQEGRLRRALTLGAVLPDTDFIVDFVSSNPLIHAEVHRGVTHSFVMLPVWALLLG
ncbi:MAG: metal-dependent hydrolase, partial [Terriglobia bacterium]